MRWVEAAPGTPADPGCRARPPASPRARFRTPFMSRYPLHVMFLWHMHQPYYKDVQRAEYVMPWVRLHATKDYLDMPLLAGRFEGVRATFNMVPSLLEQVQDYAAGTAEDRWLRLAEKPADQLCEDERVELLAQFFSAQEERMIRPNRRYGELLDRRGPSREPADLRRAARLFSVGDLRDLQAWFYLSWIDPMLREEDPRLKELATRGRNFTEEEKQEILEIGRAICAQIVPAMRELWERGAIEISTTPYYHPILPLLVDTQIARRARPEMLLPSRRFTRPEDARLQIAMGLDYCEKLFGRRPSGMWPSEGSVCPELMPMFEGEGVKWIATDEDVLAASLGIDRFVRDREGRLLDADRLYRPWIVRHEGSQAAVFFRDHLLSDLIGFRYAGADPQAAALDLVRRLEQAGEMLADREGPHVVSIILDGENCWEHYLDDGRPFLEALYGKLGRHPALKMVTPSAYLAEFPEQRTLDRLHSGSWINRDFTIWIGHPEDNAAWDLLGQARDDLEPVIHHARENGHVDAADRATKSLLVAEGSDWNWWYGDDHTSDFDEQFDMLYRRHLENAYAALGLPVPGRLFIPISRGSDGGAQARPRAYLAPFIDGRVSHFFEWFAAVYYGPGQAVDSMHQVQHEIEGLYYGFGRDAFYLRVDPARAVTRILAELGATLNVMLFNIDGGWRIVLPLTRGAARTAARVYEELHDEGWVEREPLTEWAVDQVVELRLPFARFGLAPGVMLRFQVALEQEGIERERCPARSPLSVSVPGDEFEVVHWSV